MFADQDSWENKVRQLVIGLGGPETAKETLEKLVPRLPQHFPIDHVRVLIRRGGQVGMSLGSGWHLSLRANVWQLTWTGSWLTEEMELIVRQCEDSGIEHKMALSPPGS